MKPEVIPSSALLRDAIAAIERGRKTIAVMTDIEGRLLGTISDGAIRRAILKGAALDASAAGLLLGVFIAPLGATWAASLPHGTWLKTVAPPGPAQR